MLSPSSFDVVVGVSAAANVSRLSLSLSLSAFSGPRSTAAPILGTAMHPGFLGGVFHGFPPPSIVFPSATPGFCGYYSTPVGGWGGASALPPVRPARAPRPMAGYIPGFPAYGMTQGAPMEVETRAYTDTHTHNLTTPSNSLISFFLENWYFVFFFCVRSIGSWGWLHTDEKGACGGLYA